LRSVRAAWVAVALAALLGGLGWVLLTLMPLRAAELGPFARDLMTPAEALAATRRVHPTASWPMFGGSPARVRFVASELRPPFRIVQTIPGESLIEMPPAVSEGRVVFGTHDGRMIAARTRDGTTVWSTDIGGCIASSPAVRAGIVYVGWAGPAPCGHGKDGTGGLVALSLHTGRVLWRFGSGNVEATSPKACFSRNRRRNVSNTCGLTPAIEQELMNTTGHPG